MSVAIANLEHSDALCTGTIYLILFAKQWNSLKYDLRTKIQIFLGPKPPDEATNNI